MSEGWVHRTRIQTNVQLSNSTGVALTSLSLEAYISASLGLQCAQRVLSFSLMGALQPIHCQGARSAKSQPCDPDRPCHLAQNTNTNLLRSTPLQAQAQIMCSTRTAPRPATPVVALADLGYRSRAPSGILAVRNFPSQYLSS